MVTRCFEKTDINLEEELCFMSMNKVLFLESIPMDIKLIVLELIKMSMCWHI